MCIEVAADDGTRILLDLDMPLQTLDAGDVSSGTPQRPASTCCRDRCRKCAERLRKGVEEWQGLELATLMPDVRPGGSPPPAVSSTRPRPSCTASPASPAAPRRAQKLAEPLTADMDDLLPVGFGLTYAEMAVALKTRIPPETCAERKRELLAERDAWEAKVALAGALSEQAGRVARREGDGA